MMKVRSFVGRGIRWAFAAAALLLIPNLHAFGVELFWSAVPNTPGGGLTGAAAWTTTNAHWSTVNTGPFTTVWNNANVDSATFEGTAGTVNINGGSATAAGTPITVNVIKTNVAGYSIGNGNGAGTSNTFTFSGANAGINTAVVGTTTISGIMAGGTIIKSGPGRLELGNANNPSTIKYVLKGGALTSASMARISGAAPGAPVADFFQFDGGGWAPNTGSQDTGANRGVTILAGGAFFSQSALSITTTISSPIVGSAGGDLTVTAGGPFTGNASTTAGAILILNNTGNSWNGNAILNGPSGSMIRTAINNVVPNTAVVNILAAGNVFDMGTNNTTETIKSLSGTAGTVALGTGGKLTLANPAGETTASVLTGTVGSQLIKNGAGAITLTGGSSGFSGEVVLNAGTIGVGSTGAFGSNALGPVLTINGGNLSNNSNSGRNMSANLAVNLNGDFSVDDSLSATQGQILFQGVNTIKNSNRTITVNGVTSNLGFGSALGEDVAGRSLTKAGTGILALNNAANTYSGNTTISGGILRVDADGSLGTGVGTVNLTGGNLQASASRTVATPNPINVTANSEITSNSNAVGGANFEFSTGSMTGDGTSTLTFRNDGGSGVGPFKPRFSGGGINFSNPIVLAAGANGVTQLEFFNTGADQTFSGNISGPGSINKSASVNGTGTKTILSGTNSYTGTTTINDGVLQLDGTHTGGGAYNVNDGTLQGNGATTSAVIVADGSTLSPGASVGSLGTGALTFNATTTAGATLRFDIGPQVGLVYTADLVNAPAGSLTIADPTTTFGATLLPVSDGFPGAVPDGTKYTVISYNGTWNGKAFKNAPDMGVVMLGTQQFRIRYADINPGGNFATETASNIGVGKFVTLTAVPELGSFITMGLMGCCAFGAVRLGRRYGFKALSL